MIYQCNGVGGLPLSGLPWIPAPNPRHLPQAHLLVIRLTLINKSKVSLTPFFNTLLTSHCYEVGMGCSLLVYVRYRNPPEDWTLYATSCDVRERTMCF